MGVTAIHPVDPFIFGAFCDIQDLLLMRGTCTALGVAEVVESVKTDLWVNQEEAELPFGLSGLACIRDRQHRPGYLGSGRRSEGGM